MARTVGRISLYLLDTNIRAKYEVDRLITGHLYGGDTETRIVQEKVLGIGGVRLLEKLGVEPAVFHLNEGHSAFLTLELASEYLGTHREASFADAARSGPREMRFHDTHAGRGGQRRFRPEAARRVFQYEDLSQSLKLTTSEFLALGRADPGGRQKSFSA